MRLFPGLTFHVNQTPGVSGQPLSCPTLGVLPSNPAGRRVVSASTGYDLPAWTVAVRRVFTESGLSCQHHLGTLSWARGHPALKYTLHAQPPSGGPEGPCPQFPPYVPFLIIGHFPPAGGHPVLLLVKPPWSHVFLLIDCRVLFVSEGVLPLGTCVHLSALFPWGSRCSRFLTRPSRLADGAGPKDWPLCLSSVGRRVGW